MKIWILNHVALKPSETGITRHYDIANELVKQKHEVTIFASSFLAYRYVFRNRRKTNYTENVNGVLFEWMWTLPYKGNGILRVFNMISYFFMALWRGLLSKEKPDAVVGSSVHLFACLAAYVLSRFKKATYIVEIRDLWPQTLIDLGKMSKRHPAVLLFGMLEKFVCRRADQIIVTLPGAVDYLRNLGIAEDKIHVIPNGIVMNREKEKSRPSPLAQSLSLLKKKHGKLAMYVGSHGDANALHTVIESAKFLSESEVALILIGDGPMKESLQKAAKAYSHVYFFDSIPKKAVLSTLCLADVLLISMRDAPLYQYGMSLNKLNDYMLCGKPILFAGNVANDIVTEAKAGLTIAPERPGAFADGLRSLLSLSEEELQEIAATSYAYVNDHHNIERLAQRFLAICSYKEAYPEDEEAVPCQLSISKWGSRQ
ncbi:group 1 glycosyl transferase [Fictibacillus macauensis ZFHKF-1]|uniref:Group 1 glycosyl transferase n=1 Tax=Fictibacillus macauensis ZFHKF-1 TaxID=1196324 RepID=I8UJ59_9BACL|nr:glycosyltransferase family 4 protein [Fictibacillus macauensis]EIT86925.1 group 1 glycosyl transferase [Fictibacillus macauensis ZFHKF-1]